MTKTEAVRFLVAAQDNPILAAWAWVIHEYRANAQCDVPPHEHWDAFQCLYDHGLVSAGEFNNVDALAFSSRQRPAATDVQRVLDNIKLLCPEHVPEEIMTKAKPPIEAFSTSTAMASREQGELAAAPQHHGLSRSAAPAAVEAFRPSQEILPANKQPAGLSAFARQEPQRGLPCTDPAPGTIDARAQRGIEMNVQFMCCGYEMKIIDDGGDILGPEEVSESEQGLYEYMFHCECAVCHAIFHISAGRPVPRDMY